MTMTLAPSSTGTWRGSCMPTPTVVPSNAYGHGTSVAVAGAAVDFAALPFVVSIEALAPYAAVAGTQQVATAPKQADKPSSTPNDTRENAKPHGHRPGAPPA